MTRNDPIKHVFIWPALLIVLVISIFPLIYSLNKVDKSTRRKMIYIVKNENTQKKKK